MNVLDKLYTNALEDMKAEEIKEGYALYDAVEKKIVDLFQAEPKLKGIDMENALYDIIIDYVTQKEEAGFKLGMKYAFRLLSDIYGGRTIL